VEAAQAEITLDQFAVGTRVIVRSRKDWRFAAIARVADEKVVLTVCSPSGHCYRLRRDPTTAVALEGTIPILVYDAEDTWRDNFTRYDLRW
jgi:hypothetical protein